MPLLSLKLILVLFTEVMQKIIFVNVLIVETLHATSARSTMYLQGFFYYYGLFTFVLFYVKTLHATSLQIRLRNISYLVKATLVKKVGKQKR